MPIKRRCNQCGASGKFNAWDKEGNKYCLKCGSYINKKSKTKYKRRKKK